MKEKTTKEMIVEAVKGSRNHNHVFERHTEKGIHEWSKKTLNERVLNIIISAKGIILLLLSCISVINLTNSILSIALKIVSETASLNDLYFG